MSKKITNLEDAHAMRAMGAPLNSEVIDRGELPPRSEKLIVDIIKAARRCRSAVYQYLDDQENPSKYLKLKRRLRRLRREIARLPPPNWVDEADGSRRLLNPEDAAVTALVGPRCFKAFQLWTDIIQTLERGEPVALKGEDAWPVETTNTIEEGES